MSVVARRVASVPRRTSVETWRRVAELVSADDSDARAELEGVASVAAALIAEEHTKSSPILVSGGGPLVRVYTLHGADAIEADLTDEDELSFDPTASGSWLLSLPAAGADVAAAVNLVAHAPHVEVRDVDATEPVAEPKTKAASGELALDLRELARP
jgi:hypothetical protein